MIVQMIVIGNAFFILVGEAISREKIRVWERKIEDERIKRKLFNEEKFSSLVSNDILQHE